MNNSDAFARELVGHQTSVAGSPDRYADAVELFRTALMTGVKKLVQIQ
jgi:hypothetical protein